MDIGGDDRGALALGRLTPEILRENNYDMLLVVNCYRPLTPDVSSTLEVMTEIETACGIRFTGIINNSNLGSATTPKDVLDSMAYAKEVSQASGLPLMLTTVDASIFDELQGKIDKLLPLHLQKKII